MRAGAAPSDRAEIGFGWISFALCGFIIGLIWHFIARRETATAAEEA